MSRDDFTVKTKRLLAQRVAYRCSNPECRRSTSGPQTKVDKVTNIGVAAHIYAASQRGPRYNIAQSEQERSSIENGIWLCQNCAKIIDDDEDRYSDDVLISWKNQAEKSAHLALQQQVKSEDELDTFLRLANKMPDLLEEMANDLYKHEDELIREFVVLKTKGIIFNSKIPRFEYYESEHSYANNAVRLLLDYNFVQDVTPKNHPVYRMTEKFVDLLKTLYPKT